MNHAAQQAYLETMGIQLYFPRRPLPGAKPSPDYDYPEPESAEQLSVAGNAPAAGKTSVPQKEKPTRVSTRARDAFARAESETAAELTTPNATSAATNAAKPPRKPVAEFKPTTADADTELRFNLRYYKLGPKLAVIDEVPHQQSGSGKDSIELLANILKALGMPVAQNDLLSESFRWPLLEGMSLGADATVAASQALQGFIRKHKEQDGFSNLLIFSAQLEPLLRNEKENGGGDGGESETSSDYLVEDTGHFVTLTHSLQSILAMPALKRDVWQQLQELRKRISTTSA